MSHLSSHILNTASGLPASGITVELHRYQQDDPLSLQITDNDGRVRFPLNLELGSYTLTFHTLEYCNHYFGHAFFPLIQVHFSISEQGQCHIPVLLAPYSYSTYRGS